MTSQSVNRNIVITHRSMRMRVRVQSENQKEVITYGSVGMIACAERELVCCHHAL